MSPRFVLLDISMGALVAFLCIAIGFRLGIQALGRRIIRAARIGSSIDIEGRGVYVTFTGLYAARKKS